MLPKASSYTNKLSGGPGLTDLHLSKKVNRLGLWESRGWCSRVNLRKEALSAAAVQTAYQIDASLIVVFSHTGETTRLVAKYHPQCPVLSLSIPTVRGGTVKWTVEGDAEARQQLVYRGVVPALSAPANGYLGGACREDNILPDGAFCDLSCRPGYTLSGAQPTCDAGTFPAVTFTTFDTEGG